MNASTRTKNHSRLICLLWLIPFFVSLLSGCSSSNIQWIDPEYTHRDQETVSLLIMPLRYQYIKGTDVTVATQEKLVHAYFNAYIFRAMSTMTNARIVFVDHCFQPKNLTFSEIELRLKDDKMFVMSAPDSGQVIYDGARPKYVLFFEDLICSGDNTLGASQSYGWKGNYILRSGIEYLLWDNENQQIAAFGKLFDKVNTLGPLPINETYAAIFNKFAKSMIKNSPFKKSF